MKDTDPRIWPIGLPANHEVPSSRPALSRRAGSRERVKRLFTRVELRRHPRSTGYYTTARSEDNRDAVYRVMGRYTPDWLRDSPPLP